MQFFLAALLGGFIQAAGTLVGRVLLSLGIGYATFSGIDTSVAWTKQYFLDGITGLPAVAVGIAGVLEIGTALSMLTSAVVARMVLAGLTGGTLRRMVQR